MECRGHFVHYIGCKKAHYSIHYTFSMLSDGRVSNPAPVLGPFIISTLWSHPEPHTLFPTYPTRVRYIDTSCCSALWDFSVFALRCSESVLCSEQVVILDICLDKVSSALHRAWIYCVLQYSANFGIRLIKCTYVVPYIISCLGCSHSFCSPLPNKVHMLDIHPV